MTWTIATQTHLCGGACEAIIRRGDPMLRVSTAGLSRCQACAKRVYGTTPPDSLEPQPEAPMPFVKRPAFATPKGWASRFDAKMAQAGEQ